MSGYTVRTNNVSFSWGEFPVRSFFTYRLLEPKGSQDNPIRPTRGYWWLLGLILGSCLGSHGLYAQTLPIWETPKIRGPNVYPKIVGLLL